MMPLLIIADYAGQRHILNTWDEMTLCDLTVPLPQVLALDPSGYPCTDCGGVLDGFLLALAEAAVG